MGKWQTTMMDCDACGYEWIAVHPDVCEYLECPICHHMTPAPYIEPVNINHTMRTITDHKVNGLNEAIKIQATDQPGPGGANHSYILFIPDSVPTKPGVTVHTGISFQNGPIASPEDFNGLTNEALLAVVIDRLRGFQFQRKEDGSFDESKRGTYACKENACALTHLEEALMWLQKRTRDRMARGVEGTMQK